MLVALTCDDLDHLTDSESDSNSDASSMSEDDDEDGEDKDEGKDEDLGFDGDSDAFETVSQYYQSLAARLGDSTCGLYNQVPYPQDFFSICLSLPERRFCHMFRCGDLIF